MLTALQRDTRVDLQDALEGYGQALTCKPTAPTTRATTPRSRGKTGAEALNKASTHAPEAFRNTAIVNDGAARHRAARPQRR